MIVRAVTFEPDGTVVFEYAEPADFRANGCMRQHGLVVAADTIAAAEMEDLEEAAERALKAALGQFGDLPLVDEEEVAGDDEPGYDNPQERERYR